VRKKRSHTTVTLLCSTARTHVHGRQHLITFLHLHQTGGLRAHTPAATSVTSFGRVVLEVIAVCVCVV
jgi:hypothetical protein